MQESGYLFHSFFVSSSNNSSTDLPSFPSSAAGKIFCTSSMYRCGPTSDGEKWVKPHFGSLGIFCQFCRLVEGHMLKFFCFCLFFRLAVHSLADEKVGAFRMFGDRRNRAGIGAVGHLQSFSGRAEDHVRRIRLSIQGDSLAFLQRIPAFNRNFLCFSALHIEFSLAGDLQRIA